MKTERLRALVRYIGATKLAAVTGIHDRRRWQTVATNMDVKPRVEDLEELAKAFPQYDLWLWKGEIDPANGQISPGYNEALSNLPRHGTA